MPNKKINQLTPRTPTLTDLILVGDPATGYSYKATLSAMINFVGGNIQFSSLGGISLTNPTNGQVLTFNGTNWVNQTPAAAPVSSVFGRTGAVVAAEGDYSLTQLSDVTLTSPTNGQVLKYNGTAWVNGSDTDTGITSLNGLTATTQTFATGTSGTDFNISSTTSAHTFNLPTASATNRGALSSSDWTTFNAKQNTITLATIGNSGAATFISNTLNIPNYTLAGLGGITLNSLAASSPLSYDSITGIFSIQIANSTQNGYLSSLSFNTFTNKQNAITLTTTGSSGSATFISDTLNIPTYTLSGLGGVPISRTLTINGTSFDLSADRSWTISTGGITSLNGLTASTQTFATGSSGTDFTISSTTSTHTFNIPTASSSNRGLLSSADWSTFNSKQSTITLTTTGSSGSSTLVGATLNIPTYTLAGLGGISLSSLSASAPLSYNSGTGAFSITQASGSTNGFLSSTDWTTFNNKQSTITLTTTGSSGASTFVSNTLNVPNYTLAGLGGVSGSGTTNYVSKFTGSSALGNSQIQDNGTGVGIGMGVGSSRLNVRGSIYSDDANGYYGVINATNGGWFISNQGNSAARISSTFTYFLSNTAIGTSTDAGYRLDVSGTARVREYLYMVRQDGAATIDALRYVTGGTIDIGTTFRVLGTNQWSANTGTTSYIQNNFGSKVFASQPNQNGSFTINDFQTTSLSPTIPAGYNQKVIGSSFTISSTAVNNFFGLDIRATDNSSSIANNVYGVYADATLGTNTSANRWAGYFVGRGYFSGNVGIGTTSPSARLHVQNGALTSTVTWNAADGVIISGTNFGGLQLQSPTGSGEGFIGFSSASVRNFGFIQYSNSTHRMSFATSTDGASSGSTKMQITQTGRLLLGTTTESTYLLDVNGTTRISGTELRLDNGTTGVINLYSNTPEIRFFSGDPTGYRFYRSGTAMTWNSGGSINLQISGNDAYGLSAANGHLFRSAIAGGAILARLDTGGSLSIGNGVTAANASSILDLTSTTKGFLPPRMTNAQMVAIATPAAGLVVYDTTNNKLNVYDGTNWVATH